MVLEGVHLLPDFVEVLFNKYGHAGLKAVFVGSTQIDRVIEGISKNTSLDDWLRGSKIEVVRQVAESVVPLGVIHLHASKRIDIVFFGIMQPKCCLRHKSTKELLVTVDFLKVVSEESRLKILCLLRDGEKCVCEIWKFLNLPQNLASHHLKILKDFGLIVARKEVLKVYYSIDKPTISKYNSLLNHYLHSYE